MDKIHNWINTILIAGVAILVLVGGNQSGLLGGTRFPSGISADSTSPSSGQVRGATLTITGDATVSGAVTFGTTTVSGDFQLDHLSFQSGSSTNTNLGASATSAASWFCGVSMTFLNPQTVSTSLQLPSSSAVAASTACDLDELGEFVTLTLDNATGTGDILFTRGDNSSTIRFNRGSVASTTQFQATDYMRLTIQNIGPGSQLLWAFEKFLVE
jgi:hypothetical protein